MWNPSKSVVLSLICTKLVIVLTILFLVAVPELIKSYIGYIGKNPEIQTSLMMTIYACSLPGLTALLCLHKLLKNIKVNAVFINKNVRYLRIISWCSFAASFILVLSGFYYIFFLMISMAAAFFGLILRVVKNVIEQAVIIKNENDFTI